MSPIKLLLLKMVITIIFVFFTSNSNSSNNINIINSDNSENNKYNYIATTNTNLLLSKECPNSDSIDYYRVGQCIDGYMYQCNINNQSISVSIFENFSCSVLNYTESYPIGCFSNSNTTTYYNCVEEITPTPSSYILSTFASHQCDKTQLIHQKLVKLDNCASNAYPIIYGSCNSTYYSYSYYNTTGCTTTPIYEMSDALNVCVESEVFEQSYLSECI